MKKIEIKNPFYALIVNSGKQKDNKKAIRVVVDLFKKDKKYKEILHSIGEVTRKITNEISQGKISQDLFDLISQNHDILKSLEVSDEILEIILKGLKNYGIHGKLTGGGMGGCVIALLNKELFDKSLKDFKKFLESKKFEYFVFKIEPNMDWSKIINL